MAFEIGGLADKQGNAYEKLFIIHKLLDLIDGKITAVQCEKYDLPEEDGIDVRCFYEDKEIYYQCKARNGSLEYWNLSDLKKVFDYTAKALKQNGNNEYVLVSSVGNTEVNDLCKALKASQDRFEYYKSHIQGNKTKLKLFNSIRQYTGCTSESEQETNKLLELLTRFSIHTFHDDDGSKQQLNATLRLIFINAPETVSSLIYKFIDDNLGVIVKKEMLIDHLKNNGIVFRPELTEKDYINLLNIKETFITNYSDVLLGKQQFSRSQTEIILNHIYNRQKIVLTGDAGTGKSGILLDILNQIKDEFYILPFNLTYYDCGNNTEQFGHNLGFSSSPTYALTKLNNDKPILVIIDQLDTVKALNMQNTVKYNVIKNFISELVRVSTLINLSIVITCRSFDLENDDHLKSLLDKDWTKINIPKLNANEVEGILKSLGIVYKEIPQNTANLLTTFFNLKLFTKNYQKDRQVFYNTKYELVKDYLHNINHDKLSLNTVLQAVMQKMKSLNSNIVPRILFHESTKELDFLASEGIIKLTDTNISYTHQSFYDYFEAIELLDIIVQSPENLIEWLGDKEEQSLNKTSVFINVLNNIADNHEILIKLSNIILANPNIRFNIKFSLLNFISSYDHKHQKILQYIYNLALDAEYKDLIFFKVFSKHVYLDMLINSELFPEIVKPDDSIARFIANQILDDSFKYANIVSTVLFAYKRDLVYFHYHLKIEDLPLNILDCFLENADPNYKIDLYDRIKSHHTLKVVVEIICYLLDNAETIGESHLRYERDIKSKFHINISKNSDKNIQEVIDKLTLEEQTKIWERLYSSFSRFNTNCNTHIAWDLHSNEEIYHDRAYPSTAFNILKLLGYSICSQNESYLVDFFITNNVKNESITRILFFKVLRNINTSVNADIIFTWMIEKNCFYDDFHFLTKKHHYYYPCKLIEMLSTFCSDDIFMKLENTIYMLTPFYYSKDRNIDKLRLFCKYSGEPQYYFYAILPTNRLSHKSKARLQEVKRKFGDNYDCSHGNIVGGWVISPLQGKLDKFSDKTWKKILINVDFGDSSFREYTHDTVIETSKESFSRSIYDAAMKEPSRFLNIVLQIEEEIDTEYIQQIFHAIARDNSKREGYEPAKIDLILKFYQKYFNIDNESICDALCDLIWSRSDIEFNECFIYALYEIAVKSFLKKDSSNWSNDDYQLNSTAGKACQAIYSLLFYHKNYFSLFSSLLNYFTNTSDVRKAISLSYVLLPILNIDKEYAITQFILLCKNHYQVAVSRSGIEFMNYIGREYHSNVATIFNIVFKFGDEESKKKMANGIICYHLFYQKYAEQVEIAFNYDENCRKGMLEGILQQMHNYYPEAIHYLIRIIDNYDFQEMNERLFGYIFDSLGYEHLKDLIKKFANNEINIKAFPAVLHAIHNNSYEIYDVLDELFTCIKAYINVLTEDSYETNFYENAAKILLHSYEKFVYELDSEKTNLVLDIWDEMLLSQRNTYYNLHEKLMKTIS